MVSSGIDLSTLTASQTGFPKPDYKEAKNYTNDGVDQVISVWGRSI